MNNQEFIEKMFLNYQDIAIKASDLIWDYSELSHQEYKSSALLMQILKEQGFTIKENLCNEPTAFIASYGHGKPVIGIIGEYDALPHLNQQAATPFKQGDYEKSGHGCGHNLIGAGALLTVLIIKEYLKNHQGTILYLGCCGEENNGVKPYLVKEGYLDDVDCVFGWHPEAYNGVVNLKHYACKNIDVEFFGKTAHAGAAPHLGRSALDSCELMNIGCNYLREHIIPNARIHYAYKNAGGEASNIVPDYCKLTYGIRALNKEDVSSIYQRIKKISQGAALMCETEVKIEEIMFYEDFEQNPLMATLLDQAMSEIGAPKWDQADFALAKQCTKTYDQELNTKLNEIIKNEYSNDYNKINEPLDTLLHHYDQDHEIINGGSTDVGNICHAVPTAYMFIATNPLGAPGHSWYWTSLAKSSIGHKGMLQAGKILALACLKVFQDPNITNEAKNL